MALWHRIRSSGIGLLCKRWHHSLPSKPAGAPASAQRWISGAHHHPLLVARRNPSGFLYVPVRSFAAPFKSKPKPKPKPEDKGPLLNEAITAETIRLITDDGHRIMSAREALDLAKKHDLDLVMVQTNSNPPVCKIMDFLKVKFKFAKGKDCPKSKSGDTLRNGENKEVRFTAKTEPKDLKIKAETVTRLMERGYRVKCTAMPTGKEEEGLGRLLSRLLTLIKDVAILETGPHVVDTRQAYVIVRHVKFGTKKSGKKAVKAFDAVTNSESAIPNNAAAVSSSIQDDMPLQAEDEWDPNSETENEVLSDQEDQKTQQLTITSSKEAPIGNLSKEVRWSANRNPAEDINKSRPLHQKLSASKPVLDSLKSNLELKKDHTDGNFTSGFVSSHHSVPSVVESNRYSKQSGAKGGFHQTKSTERMPHQTSRNESDVRSQVDPEHRQFNPGNPYSQSGGYGRFSAPKTAASGDQKLGGAIGGKVSNSSSTPRLGIFISTKTGSTGDQRKPGEAIVDKPRNPSPAVPSSPTSDKPRNPNSPPRSYGVFSATKSIGSGDQRSSVDATMDKPNNPSAPLPNYGIFSASRTSSSGAQRSLGDGHRGTEESKSTINNNP